MGLLNPAIAQAVGNAGLALVIVVGLYRLAHRFGPQFIAAQMAQAEALAQQAQSMEGLRDSVTQFITRDNAEHREMLVLLKYIAQHQEGLEETRRRVTTCGKCGKEGK